jgi:formylglycine-generating enzyme required for sulfatase activity
LITGGAIAAVVVTVLGAWQWASGRRAQTEREISRYVEQANREVSARASEGRRSARLAHAGVRRFRRDGKGRGLKTTGARPRALPTGDRRELRRGRGQPGSRASCSISRGGSTAHRLAESATNISCLRKIFVSAARRVMLQERIAADREGGRRNSLNTPGTLKLTTIPAASEITLERFERDPLTAGGRSSRAGTIAGGTTSLAPGSYRLVASGAGRGPGHLSVRGAPRGRCRRRPGPAADSAVPEGFVYVPPGEFWFGDADEQVRTQFLGTVPIHRRHTEAYSIARRETTYAEWIAFLDALPSPERARYLPHASASRGGGSMRLQQTGGDATDSAVAAGVAAGQSSLQRQVRRADQLHRSPRSRTPGLVQTSSRRHRAGRRDALPRMVARHQARAGRPSLHGVEWSGRRVARDDRLFPHGDELRPDEANFDQTYGRVDSAFGPDAVGSYSSSRSPFGVDDMAGNAFEFVASSQKANEIVIRGGAYYFTAYTCRSTNREPVQSTFRDMTTASVCVPHRKKE